MTSVFSAILRRALEGVPDALGAVFADWEGEAVDHVGHAGDEDLRLYGAHFGVVLNQVQRWLNLFHFGEAESIILNHARSDLVIQVVNREYYVVMALRPGSHLGSALKQAAALAAELRREIA